MNPSDGRRTDEPKSFRVSEMWNTHREIARLASLGMKGTDIATELNVSPVMVSYTLNSPVVKRQLDQLHSARDLDAVDVAKRIQEIAPKALAKLEEILDNSCDDKVTMSVAKDILDRAGHAAVKTLRTENLSVHLTKDDLEEIKQRAAEIGLMPIDVEPIPV